MTKQRTGGGTAAATGASLTQQQAARALDLSTRQVNRLVEGGMPTLNANGRRRYDRDTITVWYIRRLREEARARRVVLDDSLIESERRKAAAEAELSEIKLDEKKGALLPAEYIDSQLSKILQLLRAKLLNIPGTWSPQLIGIRTVPDAQGKLEPLLADLMTALSESGDDPELDKEPDGGR